MRRAVFVVSITVLVSLARAEDIKLLNGQVLKDAKITNQDAIGVTVSHSSGIGRIPYDMLPDELRSKFAYDLSKAREQADAEARAAAQRAQEEQAFRDKKAREAAEAQLRAEQTANAQQAVAAKRQSDRELARAAREQWEANAAEAAGDSFDADLARIKAAYIPKIRAASAAGNKELAAELQRQAKAEIAARLGRKLSTGR